MGTTMSFSKSPENKFKNELNKATNDCIADAEKKAKLVDEKVLNACFGDYFDENSCEFWRLANSGHHRITTHDNKVFEKCVKNITNPSDLPGYNDDYVVRSKYNGFNVYYNEYRKELQVDWS